MQAGFKDTRQLFHAVGVLAFACAKTSFDPSLDHAVQSSTIRWRFNDLGIIIFPRGSWCCRGFFLKEKTMIVAFAAYLTIGGLIAFKYAPAIADRLNLQ